jgi:hypothetical protein
MGLVAVVVAVQGGMAQTAKVGTFDRTSIVVAFYNSPLWSAELKAREAEMQQAKAAGDQKKAAELRKWGHAQQNLAHKQLAGDAHIDNILQTMKPMFAAVTAQAHVATIVPQSARANKNVTTVLVTDLLMGQLQAGADTRQTAEYLRDLKKTHPMKYRLYMFLFRFEG